MIKYCQVRENMQFRQSNGRKLNMNNGERIIASVVGYVFMALGGAIAITQGSQVFWSEQYAHAVHRGSALHAGFGVALMVAGAIILLNVGRLSADD
jgi:hypothetical protein